LKLRLEAVFGRIYFGLGVLAGRQFSKAEKTRPLSTWVE
jgi:hypothetical protein